MAPDMIAIRTILQRKLKPELKLLVQRQLPLVSLFETTRGIRTNVLYLIPIIMEFTISLHRRCLAYVLRPAVQELQH